MSWFPLSSHRNKTPTSRMCACVCVSKGFYVRACGFACECFCFWMCIFILQRLLKWVSGVERGVGGCFLLNDPAPTVWPWGPCVYYLMTLCPEWETDPLWVRLWRKEEQFQCILHSDLSAQHTALEVSPQPPRPLRTTKCPTCSLETYTVCMCFVFVYVLRDRKTVKQQKWMLARTFSNPLNRKYL